MAGITYEGNTLTAEELAKLRNTVGWGHTPVFQAEKALARSLYTVAAREDDNLLGGARLVGDGALIWYIQDVIVLPEYQGRGVGRGILTHVMDYIQSNSLPGTRVGIGLMAAPDKEPFYEKFGFRVRPNEHEGPGMMIRLQIP